MNNVILYEAEQNSDTERKVAKFLIDLNFPPHYIGYTYMKELITQTITTMHRKGISDKTLYNSVASKFKTSTCNIERCVRTLIGVWWDRLCSTNMFLDKPTCRECALKCAEYICLDLSPDYPR